MGSLQILARHFARSSGVHVLLKVNATPSADVEQKLIILPSNLHTECQIVVLAWLMHEAGHIRWSKAVDLAGRAFLHVYHNLLEDIRIDSKIFSEYPEVRDSIFLPAHRQEIDARTTWPNLSRPAKLLLATILRAEGLGDLIPADEQIIRFFKKHGSQVDTIVSRSRTAQSSEAVLPVAIELATLVLGRVALGRHMGARQRLHEAWQSATPAWEELEARKKERASLSRRIRYREKKLKTLPHDPAGVEEREKAQQEIRALEKEWDDEQKARESTVNVLRERCDEATACERELEEVDKQLAQKTGTVPSLIRIERSRLKYTPPPPLSRSFDDLLWQRLQELKTLPVSRGSRINTRRLHVVFTRPESAFIGRRAFLGKWKRLFFLLDGSWSMNGERAGIVRGVMEQLALSLERCRKRAHLKDELKYEIWVFNTSATRIKAFTQPFDDHILESYKPNGGTDLASALETVEKSMSRQAASRTGDILFCMTDAEIDEDDVRAAQSFHAAQIIFLGIGAQSYAGGDPETRTMRENLFLRYNITSKELLESVLQEAILRELRK